VNGSRNVDSSVSNFSCGEKEVEILIALNCESRSVTFTNKREQSKIVNFTNLPFSEKWKLGLGLWNKGLTVTLL
jgi:hypothetical protein